MKKQDWNAVIFWIVVLLFSIFCRMHTPEAYL
jgi:hypothetical protein